MIVSYRDKRTTDFADGKRVKAFSGIEPAARLRIDRFEALRGDRKGQYSIRIDDRWRICFEWPKGSAGPPNEQIVDDH